MNPRQANLSERRAHARSFVFNAWHGACCIWPARDEFASFARPTAPHRRAGWGRCSPLTFRGQSHPEQETWSGSASGKLCGGRVISASCWDKGATSTTSACPGNATGHVRPRPHQARDVAKRKAAPGRALRAHRRRRAGGEARQLRWRLQNCFAPGGHPKHRRSRWFWTIGKRYLTMVVAAQRPRFPWKTVGPLGIR